MKLKKEHIVIAVLLLLLGWQIFGGLQKNLQIKQLSLQNQKLDTLNNLLGQQVIISKTEVTESQAAFRAATDSFFALKSRDERKIKEITAFYKGQTKTVIKNVTVPYVDVPARKKWEDSVQQQCNKVIEYYEANTITVPVTAKDTTHKDYTAELTATKAGIKIDSLVIPDEQKIRFVTLKGGFLKKDQDGKRHLFLKKSVQVQVIHSNKLMEVTGQTSAVYQAPKKKNLVGKAVLVGLGVFLGTKL